MIKKLAKEFEEKFERLGENIKTWKTFSVPIEKEITKFDRDHNESVVSISYKTKFINSGRFMASSLSNLVNNLAEGIDKIKCKDWDSFLDYKVVKNNLIKHKCLSCNKDYSNKIDEELKNNSRTNLSFLIMISIKKWCLSLRVYG